MTTEKQFDYIKQLISKPLPFISNHSNAFKLDADRIVTALRLPMTFDTEEFVNGKMTYTFTKEPKLHQFVDEDAEDVLCRILYNDATLQEKFLAWFDADRITTQLLEKDRASVVISRLKKYNDYAVYLFVKEIILCQ